MNPIHSTVKSIFEYNSASECAIECEEQTGIAMAAGDGSGGKGKHHHQCVGFTFYGTGS